MIKITRELIHDMIGIPMGDIKVKRLKEKNLFDPVTTKWRGMVPEIVSHENKINISQLKTFLCTLSEADWFFDIGFLSLFFSIFGQGNKDDTINERLIPYLDETDKIHQMDLCSYVLESLVKECTGVSAFDKFSRPLLLLVEMKEILKDNLLKGIKIMKDIDIKLDIALVVNSNDEELKNIIEKRNEFYVTLYKDVNKKVKEDDEDKDKDLEKDDYEDTDGDDDDKDENNDKNDDDDEIDRDKDDETGGDNNDKDEDDDDENNNNDENDEKIRNEKEKKGGSENVEDDNVKEGITDVEQKDENVEEEKEKKKVPDDMEVRKKIKVKVVVKTSAKAVEVPDDKVVDMAKKKVAVMKQFKQPRPATKIIKVDYQSPKRGRKRVVISGKRMLESKKIHDPSLVVHQMIEDMTKLPLISRALKEAAHDARPSFNKLMFKLKRDSDGTVHVKKIDDVPGSLEKGSVKAVEVPDQKVINAAKDKTVQIRRWKYLIKKLLTLLKTKQFKSHKRKCLKINAKVAVKRSVKAVEVPPDKIVDPVKKKVAAMTQFKQARPATKIIKDDYQMPKREKKE
nr:ulp1 protease family, C-terminal catalytic domain-containing protein [Tanacetum cinerariifolium]